MQYDRICYRCLKEKDRPQDICPYCGRNPADYIKNSLKPYMLPPGVPLHGKYLVGEVLGAGGFGITYIAMDLVLERRVAVKEFFMQGNMYRNNRESLEVSVSNNSRTPEKVVEINRVKFEEEAKTLAQLEQMKGIVGVFEFFNENRTSYIVLEYLDGETLKQKVQRQGGRLEYGRVIERLLPVMESLATLHDRKILHRDISPDNIMVLNDGGMKLFDFGGAKQLHDDEEQHSIMVMKKPGYTPVEQYFNRELGPWTDEYALAATIYYCITGSRPVESIQRSYEHDPLRKPSELGAVIPAHDERVLMKALSIKPEDRYPSVRDFRAALLDSYEPPEPTRAPSGSTKTPVKPGGKPPGMSPVLVLVLVVIGVLAGILAAAGISAVLQGRQESTGTAELTADTVEDADAPLLEADEVTEETQAASEETVSTAGTASSAGTASQAQAASKENTPIPTVEPTPTAEPEETTPIPTVEPTAATDTGTKAGGNDGPRIITLEEAGLSDHEINWKDPVLEERMREKTGIKDRPVRLSDVWETQEFMINGKADSGGDGGITDISALGELRNLQRLNLNYNAIQDISPLANLENLTWLTINTNKITDLTPLKELQYLETLDASNNQIGDFSAFETMPSLARISVYGTGLNDEGLRKLLGHLEPKERVKKLDIGGNNITDYSGFAELVNIEKLAMWDSQVDDMKLKELVSVIKNLLNLTQLTLRNNEISDLTPLMELPRIEVLNLYQNLITDITPLGSLKHLKELRLGGNHISDLSPVDKSIIKDIDQVL